MVSIGNNASVAYFVNALQTSPLPVFDVRGPGIDVHGRKDKFTGALEPVTSGGTDALYDYSDGLNGVQRLLDDFAYRFVDKQYTLAGFKGISRPLEETLPKPVQAICSYLNWPCLDPELNARASTQHTNYDERAQCGSMQATLVCYDLPTWTLNWTLS